MMKINPAQSYAPDSSSVCVFQLSGSCGSGVSLLVRDSMGCTPLHLAAQHGHTEVVSFILEHGECRYEHLNTHPPVLAYSKFKVCHMLVWEGREGFFIIIFFTITYHHMPKRTKAS